MAISLENKVALITGAGSGIGRSMAVAFAKEGMKIVLFGGRRADKLNETKKLVEEYSDCYVIPGDITDFDNMDNMLEEAYKHFGTIDIVVNNAGMALNKSFEDITMDEFDAIMKVDVKVPYFLMQKSLKYLRKSQAPEIINISSVVGHDGYPMQSAYVAAKHAVLGFSKSIARELYKEGIRVHVISPGGVYTDMAKVARPDLTGVNMIMPEDIAEIAVFMLKFRGNAVVDEINVHRETKEPFLV